MTVQKLRRARPWRTIAGLTACALIAGAAVGYMGSGEGLPSSAGVWMICVAAVILMVGAVAFSVVWMRSIDEAAREAHKAAWFWGGSSGMAAGGAAMMLSLLPGAETLHLPTLWAGRTDPAAYAAGGAFAILVLMLVGYTIVWAWWWLVRR